jgi:AcrR family transcriptional regulator
LTAEYPLIQDDGMRHEDPAKERAIFAATLELIGEVGLSGLKMAAIAKRAGLGTGTLYLYFQDKEDLLNILYRDLVWQQDYLTMRPGEDSGVPYKARLKACWQETLEFQWRHFEGSLFVEQFQRSPYITEQSKAAAQEATQYLSDLLAEGQRNLEIKDMEIDVLRCLLDGFVKETIAMCKRQSRSISPGLVDSTFALCWDALRA